eukprot:4864330-Lingulodinium_polyedra.AAC.1
MARLLTYTAESFQDVRLASARHPYDALRLQWGRSAAVAVPVAFGGQSLVLALPGAVTGAAALARPARGNATLREVLGHATFSIALRDSFDRGASLGDTCEILLLEFSHGVLRFLALADDVDLAGALRTFIGVQTEEVGLPDGGELVLALEEWLGRPEAEATRGRLAAARDAAAPAVLAGDAIVDAADAGALPA